MQGNVRVYPLREGDPNFKLFHLVANGRRAKNFIPAILHEGVTYTDQSGKEALFHLVANGRKAKNFIPAILHEGVTYTDQLGKEALFTEAYRYLLGKYQAGEHTIDLDFLQMARLDLSELDQIYTEQEI